MSLQIKITVLLNLILINCISQELKVENFYENSLDNNQLEFIPLKDGAVIQISLDEEKKAKKILITDYDKELKPRKLNEIEVTPNSIISAIRTNTDISIIYCMTYSESSPTGNLVEYHIKEKTYKTYTFNIPELTEIIDFQYCKDHFVVMFMEESKERVVFFSKYNLDMTSGTKLEAINENINQLSKFRLHTFEYFSSTEELFIGYSINTDYNQVTKIKVFKSNELAPVEINLERVDKKFYRNFSITLLNPNSILIAGAYDKIVSNKGFGSLMNSDREVEAFAGNVPLSTGLFFTFYDRTTSTIKNSFFEYSDLSNIYGYVEKRIIREGKEKKTNRKKENKEDFIEFRMTKPKIILENDKITCFYKCIEVSSTYDNPFGANGLNKTNTSGPNPPEIKFTMLVSVNSTGEIINNNTYDIDSYMMAGGQNGSYPGFGTLKYGVKYLDLERKNAINITYDANNYYYSYLGSKKIHFVTINKNDLKEINSFTYDFKINNKASKFSLSDCYFYGPSKYLIFGNVCTNLMYSQQYTFLLKLSLD